MSVRTLIVAVLLAAALPVLAQETTKEPSTICPGYQEDDYIVSNYKFTSGESLPEGNCTTAPAVRRYKLTIDFPRFPRPMETRCAAEGATVRWPSWLIADPTPLAAPSQPARGVSRLVGFFPSRVSNRRQAST